MCGADTYAMELVTADTQKRFEFTKIKLKTTDPVQYDACYYFIVPPKDTYEPGAKVHVRVTEMTNLNVVIKAGQGLTNATVELVPGNFLNSTSTSTWWQVDTANKVILMVTPSAANVDTKLVVEYYAVGNKYPYYMLLYYKLFGNDKNSKIKFYGLVGAGGLLVLLLICVCVGCIRKCA
jgi:hypothetical protein